MSEQTAVSTVQVSASPTQVWQALVEPEQIRVYLMGAEVDTTWEPGSPIVWRGEYDGRAFEDTGEVLEVEPGERLVTTHYSPLSGRPDEPENYHRVTWRVRDAGERAEVSVEQTLLSGEDADRARDNWSSVLGRLKEHVERG